MPASDRASRFAKIRVKAKGASMSAIATRDGTTLFYKD